MVGILGADPDEQLRVLTEWCAGDIRKREERGTAWGLASRDQGESGYGAVEAEVLFTFVASQRPPRVVQIGAGLSTAVVLGAAAAIGYDVEVVCIDPFPTSYLANLEAAGRIALVREGAQDVAADLLLDLPPGGLLFVDSTHAVAPGSEVNRVVLEILPRLGPDKWVHFHDITFPFDYQRELLAGELFFSAESTLLHAFLAQNANCRLAVSLSMLHYARPDALARLVPSYRPEANDHGLRGPAGEGSHFPSAAYLRTVRP